MTNDELNGLSIFGVTAEEVVESVEEEQHESTGYTKFFELNPQPAANKQDMAIVKLISHPKSQIDPKQFKNIVSKTSYKVKTDDGVTFMYDSAKTLGWNTECLAADTYPKVKDDALKLKKFRSVFNYKKPSVVLVQILKYDTDPTMVGSIRPLRIYEDVETLIKKTIKPSADEIELNGAVPTNPFDVFGEALMLKAKMKDLGNGKTGRTFEDSAFVKAESYKKFLVPQLDAEGNYVTETVGENEVIQYDTIELTAEERVAYTAKKFEGALLDKLKRVVAFLYQDEKTPKHEDYGYQEPSDERKEQVKILAAAIVAGEPASLGGAIVDENATSEGEAAQPQAEATSDASNVDSEVDINNIIEQATGAQ